MAKLLTNNASIQIKKNGDVFIKRRRMLGVAGIIAGLLLAIAGFFILINIFSSFSFGNLLFAVVLMISSYFVLQSAWRSLKEPNMLIENIAKRVSQKSTILGGKAHEWEISEFSGVAVWRSGQIRVGRTTEGVYQAGLILSDGQPMALVEIPAKKCDKAIEILATATGLGIIQVGQK